MTTLADSWSEHAQSLPGDLTAAELVRARRLYMAGALQAIVLLGKAATREQLLAEISGFGRAIGTTAERACA